MVKYLFLILCLILCACDTQAPSGRCINPPEVSKDTLAFNVFGGVDSIAVSKQFWWLDNWEDDCINYYGSISDYCMEDSCFGELIKAKCSWFELQKVDEYTIIVSVYSNDMGYERTAGVGINAGNCHSGFAITQSAE